MANPYYPPSSSSGGGAGAGPQRAATPSRRPTFDPHLSPRGDVGLSYPAPYDDDGYYYSSQPQPNKQHQLMQQPQLSTTSLYPPPSMISRTPSPAPSDGVHPDRPLKWERLNEEQRRIASEFPEDLDEDGHTMLASVKKMLRNWRSWIKWRYWYYYVALIVIALMVAFFTIYHKKIITWLTPVSQKVNSVKWGWVIPVAILFVISFPPLFGHEIIAILCGIVYPLWIAFGIVALGTLLGELGNFWAFKGCFSRLAEKYERKSLNYACMAHIVREGGFLVILIARLSAIPGHFTTAVFATVGMNVFIFTLAALLSMPKQLAVVYLGTAIRESGSGEESTKSKIIKYVVLVISAIITLAAAWYLYDKMEKARPTVQSRLRAKRYTMLSEARSGISIDAGRRMREDTAEGATTRSSYKGGDPYDEEEGGVVAYQPSWQQWNHHGVNGGGGGGGGGLQARPLSMHYGGALTSGAGGGYYYQQDDQYAQHHHHQPPQPHQDASAAAAAAYYQQDLAAYSPQKEMRTAMLPPEDDEPGYSRRSFAAPPQARQSYMGQTDVARGGGGGGGGAYQRQADEPPLTPVEPLDMDVLLAATMRNNNSNVNGVQAQPPRQQQQQQQQQHQLQQPPSHHHHQQEVSSASYVTAQGDERDYGDFDDGTTAAAAGPYGGGGGHAPRYRKAQAPAGSNGHAGVAAAEDQGFSLYSYRGHSPSEVERYDGAGGVEQQQQAPPPRYQF